MDGLEDLYRRAVPTNIRTLGESLLGNTSPITEKDFSPQELKTLSELYNTRRQFNEDKYQGLLRGIPTESQYSTKPERELVEGTKDGRTTYTYKDIPYEEMLRRRREAAEKLMRNPNKTSLSYNADYGVTPISDNPLKAIYKSYTDPRYSLAATIGATNVFDEGGQGVVRDQYNFDNREYYEPEKNTLADLYSKHGMTPAFLDAMMVKYGSPNRPINIRIPK